jgi:hypothetical protein
MQLSHAQKQEIYEKGYVQLHGVVPGVMVEEALRAINHSVGEGMDPEKMLTFRSQSFCPELRNAPAITDLLNRTPAWALAESAIGEGRIQPVKGGQIALRFPSLQDPPNPPRFHIDGTYSPHNGVPQGEIRNFTMLVGVFLSDVDRSFAGNFTVWPGTHHRFERYFREHGPQSLLEGVPKVEMPEAVEFTAQAGVVVLCHYQVAHGVAQNVSPHPRYAIFFRLRHVNHEAHRFDVMTDIWLQWEGMREIVEAVRGEAGETNGRAAVPVAAGRS